MKKDIRKQQVEEAKARLAILEKKGLVEDVAEGFKEGVLYYSERARVGGFMEALAGSPVIGVTYWVSNKPEWAEAIRAFEEEHDAVVFHATNEKTEFGELLDIFYVSKHQDEWEMDKDDLENGYACCYVMNMDNPDFSEFGSIGFDVLGGGLIREY